MKKKRLTPSIRTATSEYDAVVSRVTTTFPNTDAGLVAWLDSAPTAEKDLESLELEATNYLRAAGHDPSKYLGLAFGDAEPLSRVEFAARMLNHIDGIRRAFAKNDVRNVASHSLHLMQCRYLAIIRDMEVSYRIGQTQRRARAQGIQPDEQARMQAAANAIWKANPSLSVLAVAERIAPQFRPWAPRTIRKKLSHPGK